MDGDGVALGALAWWVHVCVVATHVQTNNNLTINQQAEDRIHRLGQTAASVRYKYLISDGYVPADYSNVIVS